MEEQKILREQEKTIADELAFSEFLKDKPGVDALISAMEKNKRFFTPKQKISLKIFREKGQINSTLEHVLKIEFNRGE